MQVFHQRVLVGHPNQQRWHAKWKVSRNMYTLPTSFFARFGTDLNAQSVLISKSFCIGAQSEVIKGPLLVGLVAISLSLSHSLFLSLLLWKISLTSNFSFGTCTKHRFGTGGRRGPFFSPYPIKGGGGEGGRPPPPPAPLRQAIHCLRMKKGRVNKEGRKEGRGRCLLNTQHKVMSRQGTIFHHPQWWSPPPHEHDQQWLSWL